MRHSCTNSSASHVATGSSELYDFAQNKGHVAVDSTQFLLRQVCLWQQSRLRMSTHCLFPHQWGSSLLPAADCHRPIKMGSTVVLGDNGLNSAMHMHMQVAAHEHAGYDLHADYKLLSPPGCAEARQKQGWGTGMPCANLADFVAQPAVASSLPERPSTSSKGRAGWDRTHMSLNGHDRASTVSEESRSDAASPASRTEMPAPAATDPERAEGNLSISSSVLSDKPPQAQPIPNKRTDDPEHFKAKRRRARKKASKAVALAGDMGEHSDASDAMGHTEETTKVLPAANAKGSGPRSQKPRKKPHVVRQGKSHTSILLCLSDRDRQRLI